MYQSPETELDAVPGFSNYKGMPHPPLLPFVPKPPAQSKTLWVNLILFVGGTFVPGMNDWVTAHPEEVLAIVTLLNMALRFFTSRAIG